MSGETPGSEGQDFVAPDESKRINDPDKAEQMARAGKNWRDTAASDRTSQRDLADVGLEYSSTARALAGEAEFEDDMAEAAERTESWAYDEQQLIKNMSMEELTNRSVFLNAQFGAAKNRLVSFEERVGGVGRDEEINKKAYQEKLTQLRAEVAKLKVMVKTDNEKIEGLGSKA